MLGYYNLSLIGTSHQKKDGGACQDANSLRELENGWIVASIADGLGSAAHSEIGSDISVNTVVDFVSHYCPDFWHNDSLISLLKTAYNQALKAIRKKAEEDGNPVADYDTTLTTVIYNGADLVFAHVGDGGIIGLSNFGEFTLLTNAQKGDAFNDVVPLRAGPDEWMFGNSDDLICALLMMTDGIYDVACPPIISKTEQPIRINYVRQFMDRNILLNKDKLPVETKEDFDDVVIRLKKFYQGIGTESISDDKTILGIINTEILPDILDDVYYEEPDLEAIAEEQNRRLYGVIEAEISVDELNESDNNINLDSESTDSEDISRGNTTELNADSSPDETEEAVDNPIEYEENKSVDGRMESPIDNEDKS